MNKYIEEVEFKNKLVLEVLADENRLNQIAIEHNISRV
jgi:hypothetical protein